MLDGDGGVRHELVCAFELARFALVVLALAGIGEALVHVFHEWNLVPQAVEVDASVSGPCSLVGDGVTHVGVVL